MVKNLRAHGWALFEAKKSVRCFASWSGGEGGDAPVLFRTCREVC